MTTKWKYLVIFCTKIEIKMPPKILREMVLLRLFTLSIVFFRLSPQNGGWKKGWTGLISSERSCVFLGNLRYKWNLQLLLACRTSKRPNSTNPQPYHVHFSWEFLAPWRKYELKIKLLLTVTLVYFSKIFPGKKKGIVVIWPLHVFYCSTKRMGDVIFEYWLLA